MKQASANTDQRSIDARYRGLVITWLAILISMGMYVFLTRVTANQPAENPSPGTVEMNKIVLARCATLAILTFAFSFLFKRKFMKQAMENHDIGFINRGHILALAMCEATCLFGLLAYFLTQNPYAYLLFGLAALGVLLHFPRKAQLLYASYDRQRFGM